MHPQHLRRAISCQTLKLQKMMTMQNNGCHGRPSKNNTYTESKQTGTIRTQRPCVNKERYLFVPHLSCERQSWGPVHSCSPCAVSGLHQAGPVPKACTGRPAHSLTSGLHRREGSFPFSDFFFFFFFNLTASLFISLYLSLSPFVTPTLSPLFSLSFHGRVHRSQSLGKAWWTALRLSQLTL